jgi:hypothetical protein
MYVRNANYQEAQVNVEKVRQRQMTIDRLTTEIHDLINKNMSRVYSRDLVWRERLAKAHDTANIGYRQYLSTLTQHWNDAEKALRTYLTNISFYENSLTLYGVEKEANIANEQNEIHKESKKSKESSSITTEQLPVDSSVDQASAGVHSCPSCGREDK